MHLVFVFIVYEIMHTVHVQQNPHLPWITCIQLTSDVGSAVFISAIDFEWSNMLHHLSMHTLPSPSPVAGGTGDPWTITNLAFITF